MPSPSVPDLLFAYNQTLSNATLAFSLLYKGEPIPIDFTIITAEEPEGVKASVVWTRLEDSTAKPFIEGRLASNIKEAFEYLLIDSSAVLGDLKTEGKLTDITSLQTHTVTSSGGSYDSAPTTNPRSTPRLNLSHSGQSNNDDRDLDSRIAELEARIAGVQRITNITSTPRSDNFLGPTAASYLPSSARSTPGGAGTPERASYIPPSLRSTPSGVGTPVGRSYSGYFPPGTGMSSPYGPRLYGGRPSLTPRASSTGH